MFGGDWFGWGHGFGMGGWFLGGLLMLLFWGALIALAVLAFRALAGSSGGRAQGSAGSTNLAGDRALSILQERYAKGEITRDEYAQMRKDLGV